MAMDAHTVPTVTLNDLVNLFLGPSSLVIAVLFILYSGYKRWWVFGWQYDEKSEAYDELWEDVRKSGQLTERAVQMTAEAVETAASTVKDGP